MVYLTQDMIVAQIKVKTMVRWYSSFTESYDNRKLAISSSRKEIHFATVMISLISSCTACSVTSMVIMMAPLHERRGMIVLVSLPAVRDEIRVIIVSEHYYLFGKFEIADV